jgi:hypothetical protein
LARLVGDLLIISIHERSDRLAREFARLDWPKVLAASPGVSTRSCGTCCIR